MHFKLLLLCLLLGAMATAQDSPAVLLDQIEATVNQELITRQDVLRAMAFFPILQERNQTPREFWKEVLDELIDYKVVSREYEAEIANTDEDYETVQLAVIAKLGSMNNLYPLLRRLGMSWADFKEFIREKVIYEKVIGEKFDTKVVVSFREIQAFYTDHYLPLQESLHLPPQGLVEMTPQIERHLGKRKFANNLQQWLKELRSSYRIEYNLGEE